MSLAYLILSRKALRGKSQMFDELLKLLRVSVTFLDDKEKHKYVDQLMDLEAQYYAESNRPDSDRSDAVLDNLRFQLCNLSAAFRAGLEKPNAPAQS